MSSNPSQNPNFMAEVGRQLDMAYGGALNQSGPIDTHPGFTIKILDLAQLSSSVGQGLAIQETGYGVIYLQKGSTPGGRLVINESGFVMYPGSRIRGRFENLTVRRAGANDNPSEIENQSAAIGSVTLLILTKPIGQFDAFESPANLLATEIILEKTLLDTDLTTNVFIGSAGTGPTPASIQPFDVRAYREIEIVLQASGLAGGVAPTLTLVSLFSNPNFEATYGEYQSVQVACAGVPLSGMLVLGGYAGAALAGGSRNSVGYISRPNYFKLNLQTTGTPTGWTPANGGKLWILGKKY